MRRGRKIAKVAMARKLTVHLYWMWRHSWDYGPTAKARFAGSKTLLSYCREQGFDLVAEATEFPDHSISAVSS